MQFKKSLLIATALLSMLSGKVSGQQNYVAKDVPIKTRWAKDVSRQKALKEYPRPQMVRGLVNGILPRSGEPEGAWTNLNGLWDYVITDSVTTPTTYEGKILVPYPLESSLSGVQKTLKPEQRLWYRTFFNHPGNLKNQRILVHFGAVDCEATVYINGKEVGQHKGGYTSFSFDITPALKNGSNEIAVKVYDPTDQGIWPHGKQVLNPANIYYTPSSGIWQTVWLEAVPENYIKDLKFTPDIDKAVLNITVNAPDGYDVEVTALDNNNNSGNIKGKTNVALQLPVKNAKLWTPLQPFLYDLQVKLVKGNQTIDEVKSYFGMRKVSVGKDEKGFYRIFLNNQYVYNLGTLDQGFWPDGLYTAPTDEALKFDIEAIKAMGFNTIRKHIKVEPARWYYWADKLGMLVWQDFVNPNQSLPEGAKQAFETQLNETIDQLYNHPCITTWVLFNEKWGQYDQKRLTEYVKQKDPSRLLNAHSGEILYVNEKLRSPSPDAWVSSDIADVHSYPDPMNAPALAGRVQILGEFGGIGVFIPDHQWNMNSAWGYVNEKPADLKTKYSIMNLNLQLLEREGLAGSIYTQPFDVEGEQNGLMTYDREVVKIPFEELRKIHVPLNPDMGTIPAVTAKNADLIDPDKIYENALQQYVAGKEKDLKKLSMLAAQTGDAAGRNRFSNLYIQSLKPPYTKQDIEFITASTNKVTDPGFAILQQQEKQQPDRSVRVKLMTIIYNDVIQPYVPNAEAKPDWNEVHEKIKPYGAPGEEMYLRAKTVHTLNQQDWENYKPVAKEYIEKYGANIKPAEKQMLEDNINKH